MDTQTTADSLTPAQETVMDAAIWHIGVSRHAGHPQSMWSLWSDLFHRFSGSAANALVRKGVLKHEAKGVWTFTEPGVALADFMEARRKTAADKEQHVD